MKNYGQYAFKYPYKYGYEIRNSSDCCPMSKAVTLHMQMG